MMRPDGISEDLYRQAVTRVARGALSDADGVDYYTAPISVLAQHVGQLRESLRDVLELLDGPVPDRSTETPATPRVVAEEAPRPLGYYPRGVAPPAPVEVGPVVEASATCGARKPGWESGPEIGQHRLPCILDAGHDGGHRDALGQMWAAEGEGR